MNKRSKRIDVLCAGRHLRLVRRNNWEFTERSIAQGAVVIVAVTPDDKLLLTEQYREPVSNRVIELPAGLVGDLPHETPAAGDAVKDEWAAAAGRELLEETGYHAKRVKRMAGGPISSGLTSELVEFFYASGLTRQGPGGGVDGEDIRVHEIRLDRVGAWLRKQERNGLSVDPKVYAGLYFAEQQNNRTTRAAAQREVKRQKSS